MPIYLTMTNNDFCPTCRHALLHRGTPPPEASRCSNPACLVVYDASGQLMTWDTGPWPDPAAVADLVARGITGSIYDQNTGGSWSFRRGTTVS